MNRFAFLAVALVAVLPSACKSQDATPTASPSPAFATEQDKTLYALGLVVGHNLEQLSLTQSEIEVVKKGLADAASGRPPQVDLNVYGPKIQELAHARTAEKAKTEKDKSKGFLDSAAHENGAVRTPSGLVFRTLSPGTGPAPSAGDTVRVHYTGSLVDGKKFDSSVDRGTPTEFKLDQVIPCWTEGVQKMKVGEKARLVCPADLAYGDQGRPPVIPGGATLVFEVELLAIVKK
jgi:FKBP-type peptidyl-prolyl cis-trans isomerase FkpA